MKHIMMVCGTAISIFTTQAFAIEAMPQRKAGLWESTMSSAQMVGRNVTSQQCIDAKTDAEMLKKAMNNSDARSNCTQQNTKRTATGFEIDSVCKQGDGILTSHMVISGDFNSHYTMNITGHRTPAKKGITDTKVTVAARHMGACPSDMKPGDMKINGMLMRADGMPANMSPQQAEEMKKMMEQMKKRMNH